MGSITNFVIFRSQLLKPKPQQVIRSIKRFRF